MPTPQRSTYCPLNRAALRNWLADNHDKHNHVWLLMYKKSSTKFNIGYDDVVEECLCFGWIDSKPNKKDEESYYLFIAPRKAKSVWSALNKKRLIELEQKKLLAPQGIAKIEAAKADGSWTTLDAIEALKMPKGLEQAFKKNKIAKANFDAFPPSTRKQIMQWIIGAKTETTQSKRITETVTLAEQNIRANQWQPKK